MRPEPLQPLPLAARPEINVGIFVAYSPSADLERLQHFARRIAEDAHAEIEDATRVRWIFHAAEPTRLSNDDPHRPSDFLDEASLLMVEGPFDIVVVITDVAVVSRRQRVVAGVASPVSHIAVLSTRKLLLTPRGESLRALETASVRWNGACLLLHLLGHILGLDHARGPREEIMAPFAFDEGLRGVPHFGAAARRRLERLTPRAEEREQHGGGIMRRLGFHLASALRHPGQVLYPLLRNRAPLLPLALPSLATAAVAPTFILIFTAEIWDVGLHMTNRVAWIFALASILAATGYLTRVQNLFFPHKEKRILTEHMAVVNVAIFLTILLASIGLFVMVGLLMLLIEIFIFPADLIATWPTLQAPEVDFGDKLRLAAFISTIGVLTGALAGGLESRAVIRHLALFLDEP